MVGDKEGWATQPRMWLCHVAELEVLVLSGVVLYLLV